jgi:putative transcriptional regulator
MTVIFVYMQYIYYICLMENMKMKLARVEKGLSQEELAVLVEATRQTVGLIEKGKYNPTLNLCVKIAKALDKTLNELFWEES